ncbi:retroviral-like aspartic protease family protein [Rhodopila globiformis]|uniref:retroviral-like aspartic protease family protein n=1 Tax=Rhodopila globiformis TaxID=1071 RepID=UPI00130503DD|nr:retroviral-like aspartic protease family protein [Rhodopila globiformis]
MLRQIAAMLLVVACLLPTGARAACSVEAKATVPLGTADNVLTLPVQVNGITATFVLDTGAQRSLVSMEAVQRLGLTRDPWVGTTMSGIGGIDRRPNADPRSLSLGGVTLVRRTLNHDNSLTVGILPRPRVGNRVIDGLLGRDFLSVFDLDLDMPGARLTLFHVHDCAGRFLPWQGDYTSVPVSVPTGQALVLPVTLDGTPLRALLDTGSSASLVARPGMFRLGLQPSRLAADPAKAFSGLGPRSVVMRLHRFRTLQVGQQVIQAPLLWVAPIRLSPIVDMLLGVDWLVGRRIWISFATRQIFVAGR